MGCCAGGLQHLSTGAERGGRGYRLSSTAERIATMKLLHIDSSILGAGSVSRALTAEIVATQRRLHPGLEATYRDLAAKPPLHLSPAHIAAWQTKATPEEEGGRKDLA